MLEPVKFAKIQKNSQLFIKNVNLEADVCQKLEKWKAGSICISKLHLSSLNFILQDWRIWIKLPNIYTFVILNVIRR